MKAILLIPILFLIVIFCAYLCISINWKRIDVIDPRTARNIKELYVSGFDAENFRIYVHRILEETDFLKENKIIFHTPFYERRKNPKALNAHAGLPGQNLIIFTPFWAVRLYKTLGDKHLSANSSDFFRFALGHEMSHKEPQYKPLFSFGKKRICAVWIREIHADFGGMRKTGLTVERIRECVETEIFTNRKRRRFPETETHSKHPTWEYRLSCMETGCFDDDLIEKVCVDCGVKDERFHNKMKKYYRRYETGSRFVA